MILPGLLFDNPVLTRELRRRMRQRSTIIVFLLYLAAMCLLAWQIILFRTAMFTAQSGMNMGAIGFGAMRISDIGASVFYGVLMLQGFLVLAVAPSITTGMVKGEKEKETFEFLRATSITPLSYLVGALLSSLLLVGLSLLCAFPVLSLALLYGGVQGIVPAVLTLMALSLFLSSQGLMWSASTERLRTTGQQQGGLGVGLTFGAIGFLIVSNGLSRGFSGGIASLFTAQVTPLQIPIWVVVCLASLLGGAIFLLVAHRKFFDPGERALNPMQFGLFWLPVLAGTVATAVWQVGVNMPQTPSGRAQALAGVYVVALLGAVLAPSILLPVRLRMGDERWHRRNRNPRLRNIDDPMRHTIAYQAVAAAVLIPTFVFIFPDNVWTVVALSLQLLLLLGSLNLGARILLHRTPFVSQAAAWLRTACLLIIVAPVFLLALRSGGTTNFELNLPAGLSPVGLLSLSVDNQLPFDGLAAVQLSVVLVYLAIILSLWTMFRTSVDRHALEVVAYDDGTTENAA